MCLEHLFLNNTRTSEPIFKPKVEEIGDILSMFFSASYPGLASFCGQILVNIAINA
jgi:hypothetical protein